MSESSDWTAVQDCLAGRTESFEKIVERYQKPIFNAAIRMVKSTDDAQDITQTVFVKAFDRLKSFNPKYRFFSWIYRMTINESINFLNQRRQHAELHAGMVSTERTPEERLDQSILAERVQDALMCLKPDYRAAVVLRHFEEFSYQEMSFILDIPEKTVKSRLFTARRLLKDFLLTKGAVTNA